MTLHTHLVDPQNPLDELKRRCEGAMKKTVAHDLGITQCVLSDLLAGRRPFTPAIGKKLGFVLTWKRIK
jgi:plasmid maintenance system antidote protein VapI